MRVGAQSPAIVSPALYSDLTWRCTGPFDGGPVASVEGVAGQPGVYVITTPGGGAWRTTDGGETWTATSSAGVSGDPHRWIDPANPRRIVVTDPQGIAVSLDAGATWVTSHNLPIAEVAHLTPRERATEPAATTRRRVIGGVAAAVSIADPKRPGLVFAGTTSSVYVSFDDGAHWSSLRLNMPSVAINDLDIRGNDLVAATQGRSVWELDDITPLRQVSAASASAAAMLFRPADAEVASSVNLDYYLRSAATSAVTIEVIDPSGRVVHEASSAAPASTDSWLAVSRPLPNSAGHHRVVWNLRLDPPPSPHHQFAQLARAVYQDMPANPDGPRVLAGTYRVRLAVGGRVFTEPLTVREAAGTTPAAVEAEAQQFGLEMQAYEAMEIAHRAFLQLRAARAAIKPLLASNDADLAAEATTLDGRLNTIDGSDWTGLIIPDADDPNAESFEEEEKEGIKHPDFVPPKPVSLTKDYDDPTTILGRNFANVAPSPAFVVLGTKIGELLTRAGATFGAPATLAADDYGRDCGELAGVLDTWRSINAQDLPALNAMLAARKLPPVPIATSVPALACSGR